MARTVLVSDLMKIIRQRTNQEKSRFVTDDELLALIEEGYTELYDLLTTEYADYFVDFANFTTQQNINFYQLPANFYKVRGVDALSGNVTYSLERFPFENRQLYANSAVFFDISSTNIRYCILGNTIMLLPAPPANLNLTMYYYPTPIKVTSADILLDGVAGYESFITADACSKIAIKAEEDPAPFFAIKKNLIDRIKASANVRDLSASSVLDVRTLDWGVYYSDI